MPGSSSPPRDIHDLDPQEFLEEVHSFEFWFQAVEGYLSGLTYGHRPETAEAPLTEIERDRLITVLCNYCVGETAALEGASGLIAIAPNRLHTALGQQAQQLRLQVQRQLADLVEQQRPSVGLPRHAGVIAQGPREGAAPVAEQLGLEQLGRQRGAVDAHERPGGARPALVQRAREHLLAGACLAGDQDWHLARRQTVQ